MKRILFIAFTLIIINSNAQQIVTSSMYLENLYSINPAVAGTSNFNPLVMSYRKLWTGIDGSPLTQYLNSHIALKDNIGIGCKLYNSSTGLLSRTGVEGTYAYHFTLSDGSKLSLGLSLLLYEYRLEKSKLVVENPDDNTINLSSEKLIIPDATFGVYYYKENYYVGLSIPQLLNRKVDLMNKGKLEERQVRHYFLNGGYKYKINEDYTIEPNVLLKFIEAGVFQAEIGCRTIFMNDYWAGLSYRTQDALILMVGIRKERFACGYSYDYTLSNIGKYTDGTHELMFIYNFNRSRPKLL